MAAKKKKAKKKATKKKAAKKSMRKELLEYALGMPGAYEDHPWGDTVAKVGKKVFVFLGVDDGDGFGLSAKLPRSGGAALMLPFATPTGYGLGKAGWVSASFEAGEDAPIEMLKAWIDESYRAIAPKKMVKELDGAPAEATEPAAKKVRRRSP